MNIAKSSMILSSMMLCAAAPAFAQVTVNPDGRLQQKPEVAKAAQPVEDPRISLTKMRYGFKTWAPASASHDGVRFLDLKLPGLTSAGLECSDRLPTLQSFADSKGLQRVSVNWGIHQTSKQARADLLAMLTAVNSPKLLPTTRSVGIEAGDVGYIGYSRMGRISWIAFSRGNITVRVNCLDPRMNPHPNMGEIAVSIDQLVQIQPLLKDGIPLNKPSVRRFESSRSQCVAGDWIELDLQVDNVIQTDWQIAGSSQGYVEKRDGRWMLRVTGPGNLKVKALLTGSNGVANMTSTIEIQANDDD
jgi:hypothetical protein